MTERGRNLQLIGPALAFLALVFLFPVIATLSLSVMEPQPGFVNFLRIIHTPIYVKILANSFLISGEVAALCLALAYPTALFIVSQRSAVSNALMIMVVVPFFTSLLVRNYAWVFLLGSHGAVNGVLESLGLPRQDLMYNRFSVIVGMTNILLPYGILILVNILRTIRPSLLQAGMSLGSGSFSLFRRVVLPLSRSGAGAALTLIFVIGLAFFVTPAMLGSPRETMIANTIATEASFLNWGFATALGIVLLVASLAALCAMQALFGGLAVIAPHLRTLRTPRTRKWKFVPDSVTVAVERMLDPFWSYFCGLVGAVVLGLLVLPILFVIPLSLTSADYFVFPPPGLSLRWYAAFFDDPRWMTATGNSFLIAALTAMVTLCIAIPAALAIARSRSRLVAVAYLFVVSPLIIPTIITAISIFFSFARFGLVETVVGLVLGQTVIALPVAVVVLVSAFSEFDWALERAALSLGSTRVDAARRVVLPLVIASIVTAGILAFLASFDDLLIALFIGGIRLETLPRLMWESLQEIDPTIAAASTVVTVVVITMLAVLQYLRSHMANRSKESVECT